MNIDGIASKCNEAAYKVLSDSKISKTTAAMSEEGREAVAIHIAKKLCELLEENEEKMENKERIFIQARPYNPQDLGL